jgi:hypothetical protein
MYGARICLAPTPYLRRVAHDSPLERDGFEPSVPLKAPGGLGFRFSFTPTSPLAGNQLRSGRSERSPDSYWRGLQGDLTLDRDGGSIRFPGSFARICRSVFSRRDIGYWSDSIIPVKRLMRAAASSVGKVELHLAEHYNRRIC